MLSRLASDTYGCVQHRRNTALKKTLNKYLLYSQDPIQGSTLAHIYTLYSHHLDSYSIICIKDLFMYDRRLSGIVNKSYVAPLWCIMDQSPLMNQFILLNHHGSL